jgi:hypothetical protein
MQPEYPAVPDDVNMSRLENIVYHSSCNDEILNS